MTHVNAIGSRKPDECREEQRNGLGVLTFWDEQEWPDVNGAALQTLNQDEPRNSEVQEGQHLKSFAVQSVIWVVTGPIIRLTKVQKLQNRGS